MPYAFLGLGRTNNYIESLFAGSTSPRSGTTLEGVIPNSKLVLNPVEEGDAWRKELFLRPGEWIWWVLLTLIGATLCLLVVVVVLHVNEKVSSRLDLLIILVSYFMIAGGRERAKKGTSPHQFRCFMNF